MTTAKKIKKEVIKKTAAKVTKPKAVKVVQPKITVLYEDDDILAVDKPAGLLVHEDGKDKKGNLQQQSAIVRAKENTLSDWLVARYPQVKDVGDVTVAFDEELNRSGIVHRLDKETSGVILLAKTQKGFECLKKQFQDHEIKKIYHTFVVGTPRQSRGIIDQSIGKSGTDFRARSAARGARGYTREAITQYMVKQSGKVGSQTVSFVQAMPKTGRTHQIRVHMKVIGHPIVGDSLYGHTQNTLGFRRTALHSVSIEFKNCARKVVKVEAPYPEDFKLALTSLQK